MLKQADAFLLTSRDESYSLVVGESLIVGTPVIATDCAGVSEWLEEGKYGMQLQNSTDAIFAGMKAVLDNPQMLAEYRKRIPQKQKTLSFESSIAEFEKILA